MAYLQKKKEYSGIIESYTQKSSICQLTDVPEKVTER
jgi:hypothetical protein